MVSFSLQFISCSNKTALDVILYVGIFIALRNNLFARKCVQEHSNISHLIFISNLFVSLL